MWNSLYLFDKPLGTFSRPILSPPSMDQFIQPRRMLEDNNAAYPTLDSKVHAKLGLLDRARNLRPIIEVSRSNSGPSLFAYPLRRPVRCLTHQRGIPELSAWYGPAISSASRTSDTDSSENHFIKRPSQRTASTFTGHKRYPAPGALRRNSFSIGSADREHPFATDARERDCHASCASANVQNNGPRALGRPRPLEAGCSATSDAKMVPWRQSWSGAFTFGSYGIRRYERGRLALA